MFLRHTIITEARLRPMHGSTFVTNHDCDDMQVDLSAAITDSLSDLTLIAYELRSLVENSEAHHWMTPFADAVLAPINEMVSQISN